MSKRWALAVGLLVALAIEVHAATPTTIKLRGATAATWTSTNPVLAAREPGVEMDTRRLKIGDGTTAWNDLPYAAEGGSAGSGTVYQADCSTITEGLCVDTDDGQLYYYNGTAAAEVGAAIDLGAPGPIGDRTPNTGKFTQLGADSLSIVPPLGETGEMAVHEDPGSIGDDWVGFKAPTDVNVGGVQAGDLLWELPAADGTINQVMATNGAGKLNWASVLLSSAVGTTVQGYDVDLGTASNANLASNSTYFGKNASGTVGFHAFPTGTILQWYDSDLGTASNANLAPNSTYFGKNASGTVGFFALPSASMPAWMPSTGPTNGRQILQATGGCSNTTYDNQVDCEANAGTWTIPVYASTSILQGLINDAGTGADDLLSASEINTRIATSAATRQPADADLTKDAVVFVIDGGGSAITTGIKADLEVPWNATITSETLVCDQAGSIVMDLWKDTYANYPATVADTITASAKPTLSAATKSQNTTLTGWTTTLAEGDILRTNVDSAATVTRCTLSLKVTK